MKKHLLISMLLVLANIIHTSAQTNLASTVSVKTASYTPTWNSVNGLNDNSLATAANYWGCWQNTRTATNWVGYQWASAQDINKVTVYFNPDNLSTTGWGDNVPVPESWKVQYSNDGTNWVDVTLLSGQSYTKNFVASNANIFTNAFPNTVQFEAISTPYLRLYMDMQSNGTTYAATCIGEWQVFGGTNDARLSSLKINGLNIGGFSPESTTYNYNVPAGVSLSDLQITATTNDVNATKIITQAEAFPGSATIDVTAPDGTTTKTYTVNFSAQSTNYLNGWDGGGVGYKIPANASGWGVAGKTPAWQGVVPSSTTDNYRDFTTAPVTGAPTGRSLYALGGSSNIYFSYPVKLQAGKYYNFSCTNWSRNATANNVTYSIYSNASGTGGTTFGSQTHNFTGNTVKAYSFNFAIPYDATYYLLRNSTQSGIIDGTFGMNMTLIGDACTVTFNTDGGSSVDTQYFVPGTSYTVNQPINPTKTNYAFSGWYTDETYATAFNFTTPVTDNTIVYAKFTQDPVLQTSISSKAFTTFDPKKTFTISGVFLVADLTITTPAGITIRGINVTGTAPNYKIALADANTTNTITATWDGITPVSEQNITFASMGATTQNVELTSDNTAQFAPTDGQSYYLIQGPTSLVANANKVIGKNSVPALVSALNDKTQQFTFEAVPSAINQYYIRNGAGEYLNSTSETTVDFETLNGDYSIWFIKGTTATGLRLINKQAYSYLHSLDVTAGSVLTLGGAGDATNGTYTLVASNVLCQNYMIDGGFEYSTNDGAPLGEWVSAPSQPLGAASCSRIRTGAQYASSGSSAFMLRFIQNSNDYNRISNTLTGLTPGHTYTLNFKYKIAHTNENSIPVDGSIINIYASNTQNGDLTTALGGGENYVSTTSPTSNIASQTASGYAAPTLTFTADQPNTYLVFAKNDNSIYFLAYVDEVALTDVTIATYSKTTSSKIKLYKHGGNLNICGLVVGDNVEVYNISGQPIRSTHATSENLSIALSRGVYLIKVNTTVMKIVL
ncbi:MAG: InlB B-repeat-containing protein [Paludibacter sp.]|nr:InlB B-repeat-containing protein [Paludibacter sp.]